MEKPSELIRRSRGSMRQQARRSQAQPGDTAPVHEKEAAVPKAHHAVYSQIMRSHDRVHTRHLG